MHKSAQNHGEARPVNGGVVWITGLSGAGKTTLADALRQECLRMHRPVFVLDGDCMRKGLCRDLGFSISDRRENIRRIAEVAALFADAGFLCITALISPFREDRAKARAIIGVTRFSEVYLAVELSVCEMRDPKGLYRKARAGELPRFTGIDSPYEKPLTPDLSLDTHTLSVAECTVRLLNLVQYKSWI